MAVTYSQAGSIRGSMLINILLSIHMFALQIYAGSTMCGSRLVQCFSHYYPVHRYGRSLIASWALHTDGSYITQVIIRYTTLHSV